MTSPFLGFCTDDRNPLDIAEEGHIDHLIRRSIALGAPIESVYRAATWSAARGFGLTDRDSLRRGSGPTSCCWTTWRTAGSAR